MPMHGELRHLRQHGRLAQTLGYKPEDIAVVENGTVVEILNGAMRIGERIPGGYIFVDGSSVGEVSVEVMREREKLSRAGVVIVHADLDSESGQLMASPMSIPAALSPLARASWCAWSPVRRSTRRCITEKMVSCAS